MTKPVLQNTPAEDGFTCTVGETTYQYALHDETAVIVRCGTSAESLLVPEELDGYPVVALSHSALSNLASVREIVLPASIRAIGPNAFAKCANLKRLVLPPDIDHVDRAWLAGLDPIDEVVLPEAALTIDAEFMKACQPKRLVVGRGTRSIDIPPLWAKSAGAIIIDPENPYLATDGFCLYSQSGETLLSCIAETETFTVQPGCRTIAKKAFAYNTFIQRIELPDTLETIGEYAFLNTKLETFEAPPHLKIIGANAFMRCMHMHTVMLNDELEYLGDNAFASCTSLEKLVVPASVSYIGKEVVNGTNLVGAGTAATFALDPANETYILDDQGILYRRTAEELTLVDQFNPALEHYAVREGTTALEADAFANQDALRTITLPEGLTDIGINAFKGCTRLTTCTFPSTLHSIGTRAFFNTALESVDIPAHVNHIGTCAFAVDQGNGAIYGISSHSLSSLTIQEGNERFFLHNGMLCERMGGYVKIVQYIGPDLEVTIPREATDIAAYAFSGAGRLTRLRLHEGIVHIGTLGLGMYDPPIILEVELTQPVNGRSLLSLRIPRGNYGLRGMRAALASGRVEAEEVALELDRVLPYARERQLRVRAMLERLADPFLLSDVMESCFRQTLQRTLTENVAAIADMEWNEGFEKLAELGIITRDTIDSAIDTVNEKGHVASTAYLIALKRRFFGATDDYAL